MGIATVIGLASKIYQITLLCDVRWFAEPLRIVAVRWAVLGGDGGILASPRQVSRRFEFSDRPLPREGRRPLEGLDPVENVAVSRICFVLFCCVVLCCVAFCRVAFFCVALD